MNESQNGKQQLLLKIQKSRFALVDLSLYLDSHKTDKKALELFKKYGKEYLESKKEYVEKFGALTHEDMINKDDWCWANAPWPWEMEV